MKYVSLILCIMFAATATVQAEMVVCGDSNGVTKVITSIDPSKVQGLGIPNCTVLTKNLGVSTLDTQKTLYNNTPLRYLKVTSGLLDVKTQSEKDAVDAVIATQVTAKQELIDESDTKNQMCNPISLQQIKNRVTTINDTLNNQIDGHTATAQTSIDNLVTLVQAKTALTTLNTEMTASIKQVKNTLGGVISDMAACLYVRRTIR